MKILIATGAYPPEIGGPATYSKLMNDELPRKGIAVEVLSFGSVRKLPKVIRHIVFALKMLWKARAADAIFAQDAVSVGLPSLAASRFLGKPLIVRVPGDHAWEQSVQRHGVTDGIDDFQKKRYGVRTEALRSIQRLVVGKADRVLAPSKYFAALVGGWVADPGKVKAVYNGIDLSEASRAAESASPKKKTIISAGRLVSWKGFDMLIRSLKSLPAWKLSIAGEGPEEDRLKEIAEEEGVSDRVAFLGRLPKGDLLREIAASEVFVLNTAFESFSFQVVEAMAVGTPVITTKVGNLPEIVEDGTSGILVDPNDSRQIVAAIGRVSADDGLRRRLSAEGRKRAERFSIGTTVDAVCGILGELDGSWRASHRARVMSAKIARYVLSGGTAAVTDLVLLYVFTDIFGIWYLLSSILAFLVAFVVSFVLQKFFTFQDHGMDGVRGQAASYLLVTGTNLLLNTGILYALVQYAGFHYMLAQIVASLVVAIEGFIIYGMFIFKDKARVRAPTKP